MDRYGVYSVDTHGEGWDLMPVHVMSVELGERVVQAMNPLTADDVEAMIVKEGQRSRVLTLLIRFAQNVDMWVDHRDAGLTTRDEFITDIKEEVKQLEWHLDKMLGKQE